MDVVYIRSYPQRPQGVAESSSSSLSPTRMRPVTSINSNIHTSTTAAAHDADSHRRWRVSVRINDADPTVTTIRDPFQEAQYQDIFEGYLRHSDRPRFDTHRLTLEREPSDVHLSASEVLIRVYGEQLLSQLGLTASSFTPGATECRVVVVEDPELAAPGIHCLAWELLEGVYISRLPKLSLRVTRMSDFPKPLRHGTWLHRADTKRGGTSSLAAVQADQGAMFKVLLVVARDFSRTGGEHDPEPDLAQWPLMNVQKKLRSRLLLEVVRPGSREELENHLAVRELQGVRFNLVHFDLHGRIMLDEHGVEVPWLLFARKDHVHQTHGYQVPQTNLAKAESIAHLLARYNVENVVLNACLSAYNRTGSGTSLAHIFLRHGIENVSAMWFYVHWQTVATYLDTFYDELLVKCVDFHVAAQHGREAIRKTPTCRTGREYLDFFLCVNYKRGEHRADTNTAGREPSPTPSARSGDSSTSNNSVKSFVSGVWKPSTPRLGDSFIVGDEPVMRMKLHLLELEYKLMTFRVVYASDLGRDDSKLAETMNGMINMWLSTNMVDEVLTYRAKDFGKRKLMDVSPHQRRSRGSNGGYLQLLFPRPVKALRQTLHIVTGVDQVVDPGYQADEVENRRSEQRRGAAQEKLGDFATRVHSEESSYLLLLGRKDAQWWREHLQHLNGDWWLHIPWSFTVHSRYMRPARTKGKQTMGDE